MIIKGHYTENFTVIGNSLVNDVNLSAEDIGLLIYLLSKPHDWVVRRTELQRRFNCGRDRVRRILKELCDARYMRRIEKREMGRYIGAEFIVFPEPQTEFPPPETDNPSPVNPPPDNPPITKEKLLQNKNHNKSADDKFSEFWAAVPKKVAKGAAKTAYRKAIKKASSDIILEGIKRYSKETEFIDQKFVVHPHKWLDQERWSDESPRRRKVSRNALAG